MYPAPPGWPARALWKSIIESVGNIVFANRLGMKAIFSACIASVALFIAVPIFYGAPKRNLPPPDPGVFVESVPMDARGKFVVQVSSQRSEVDAQASYRSLQARFPEELGDREAMVRRADLGPKGVYYRAMVGVFSSARDAHELCGRLKAAGGQCLVQKD